MDLFIEIFENNTSIGPELILTGFYVETAGFLFASFFRYMMNDDALIKELDMEKFEEEFKLDDVEPKQAKPSMSSLAKPASQDNPAGPAGKAEEKKVTKLDSKRQMTVAFARRQIPKNFTDRDLVKAVNNLDTDVLKINEIELLQRMIPQVWPV